jgi:hypothetical protein
LPCRRDRFVSSSSASAAQRKDSQSFESSDQQTTFSPAALILLFVAGLTDPNGGLIRAGATPIADLIAASARESSEATLVEASARSGCVWLCEATWKE